VYCGVQQHFLQLGGRGAVVQCTPHVALELILLAQRGEHRHGDEAARLQVEHVTLPDVTPGFACDVLLDRLGKRCHVAQRIGHKGFAHDLLAHGQAAVEFGIVDGFHGHSLLETVGVPATIPQVTDHDSVWRYDGWTSITHRRPA
jgi:hypothetical protein